MRVCLLFLLTLLLGGPAIAADPVVSMYNWTDYIDPQVLQRFTRETGIRVQYDAYDSLETLEAKMLAGHSGYDVIVPTSEPTFSRLIRSGALQPLDRAAIPNLAGLDPALMARVASSDPGNRYGAIYLWGSTGLGVDPAKLRARAPDVALDSWDLIFKPENAKRFADCGITMMDSAIDVVPSVLAYLGKSPSSTDDADLAAVRATLMAIRPYIRAFAAGGTIEALAAGDTCLAVAYSGDVIQAAARAGEAGHPGLVRYVAPKEGVALAFDMLAVPKDAPHAANAFRLIDYLLRPDVMAAITNTVRYPNAVPASRPMIKPAILDDPGIYPPPGALAHVFTAPSVPPAAARARSRMWAAFKAGG